MKKVKQFNCENIRFVFSDIDDTLTTHGKISPEVYEALWKLSEQGYKVVPVTGRPAGWCDLIARQWPVDGVVGENGGFYFRLRNGRIHRTYLQSASTRSDYRAKLIELWATIQKKFPHARLARDQFTRKLDLAIDIGEDVSQWSEQDTQKLVALAKGHGATAKVSSIHVNCWYGDFDKASTCFSYLKKIHGLDSEESKSVSVYCGDSPNDEPLFKSFPYSVGVRNVERYLKTMKNHPAYITQEESGRGFVELAHMLLASKS